MRLPFALTVSFALVVAAPALALDPGGGDGPVLPRSPAEAARVAVVTAPTATFDSAEPYEANSGGGATVPARTDAWAFSEPAANLDPARELDFLGGKALFEKIWIASPSSTLATDGLGPLYNARACVACHLRDGRGHPPVEPGETPVSLVLHIAVPVDPTADTAAIEDWFATAPDPRYGAQIQTFATAGLPAEARLRVGYEDIDVPLADGETVTLRAPRYALDDLTYGPLSRGAVLSPRIAPPMIGLGLLAAIPAADILALADPDDADGDGISGRANIVWSPEADRPVLGRFGLKAGVASLAWQTALAFAAEIGISTPARPAPWGDCTPAQAACRAAPHGDGDARGFEADQAALDLVSFYAGALAVPARRDVAVPEVLAGKRVFYQTGCTACHSPKFVTARLPGAPSRSFQLIWPYSDLLLHDMGPGLADGFAESRASGTEWRTAPLWGIGLTEQVTGSKSFLHDGRARNLLEAILWHGGEAQTARDAVVALPRADRNALIRFLESL